MRPSLLTWLGTSLSAGFASVWRSSLALLPNLVLQALLALSSAACPCCVELLTLSYRILSQARRLETCKIDGDCAAVPGDCAAVCSRSGIKKNRDLAASHRLGHLCFTWHVWSRCNFLRDLHLFLKVRYVVELPGCEHFIGDVSRVELEMQIRLVLSLKSHAPRVTDRQCLVPKLFL